MALASQRKYMSSQGGVSDQHYMMLSASPSFIFFLLLGTSRSIDAQLTMQYEHGFWRSHFRLFTALALSIVEVRECVGGAGGQNPLSQAAGIARKLPLIALATWMRAEKDCRSVRRSHRADDEKAEGV
jgi:hypothetical protein